MEPLVPRGTAGQGGHQYGEEATRSKSKDSVGERGLEAVSWWSWLKYTHVQPQRKRQSCSSLMGRCIPLHQSFIRSSVEAKLGSICWRNLLPRGRCRRWFRWEVPARQVRQELGPRGGSSRLQAALPEENVPPSRAEMLPPSPERSQGTPAQRPEARMGHQWLQSLAGAAPEHRQHPGSAAQPSRRRPWLAHATSSGCSGGL